MPINETALTYIENIKRKCEIIKPLVVIRCIAYNHEKYIRSALDGFLIQKTNFPFIAIIHDDFSTDKTTEIIKEYSRKYPDLIFPIFENENQYSKKKGIITSIMDAASFVTNAKYIAECEGDDYWIDPLKLQKQVDFMEANPEYTLCFHKSQVIAEDSKIDVSLYSHLQNREYSANDVIKKWTIPTASVIFKSELLKKIPFNPNFCVGDNVIFLTCAQYGKLYCLADTMSVYRRQSNGWYLKKNKYEIRKKMIIHYKALLDTFTNLELPSLKNNIAKDHASITFYKIKNKEFSINYLKRALQDSGIRYFKYLILFPLRKIIRK